MFTTRDGSEVTPGQVAKQLIASGFTIDEDNVGIMRRADGTIAAVRPSGESKIFGTDLEGAEKWINEAPPEQPPQ